LAPPVKETVNTPVGAAVTRVQPPVPKLLAPVEASVQAVNNRNDAFTLKIKFETTFVG
jgi:hypothetical protein